MAELYGKATGCCAGKGGSMHLGDPAVGMLPAIAIVGGGNTVVTGLGLGFQLRKTDQVAVCFFGDGASNEGAFHEGMNFAAVRGLPIVFVCENNLYGASTPFHAGLGSRRRRRPRRRLRHPGPRRRRDGRPRRARGRRRGGRAARAPATARRCSSARPTASSATAAATRAATGKSDEEAAWKARDPIPRLRVALVDHDEVGLAAVEEIEHEVEATIDDAVEFARASPDADPAEALTDVYA